MKLFLNEIPVNVEDATKVNENLNFDTVIEGGVHKISAKILNGNVLIKNSAYEQVDELFKLMTKKKLKSLSELTFGVKDKKATARHIKSKFKIIKAGGGLVEKGNSLLMIYRLKKWDLPKGKIKKRESTKEGAVREVEEECNIKVMLGEKICRTWHSYIRNEKYILKRTDWFVMRCVDDTEMAPQTEESIEEVRWMDDNEVEVALYSSYATIRYVFQQYHANQMEVNKV